MGDFKKYLSWWCLLSGSLISFPAISWVLKFLDIIGKGESLVNILSILPSWGAFIAHPLFMFAMFIGGFGILIYLTRERKRPIILRPDGKPYEAPKHPVLGVATCATIVATMVALPIWLYFHEPIPPEVTLQFVYPQSPALQLINISNKVARDIKYMVTMWNLDLPERVEPLLIPVSTFDWIRPHEASGPQSLFFAPQVASLL
jgi:hypothetical protein